MIFSDLKKFRGVFMRDMLPDKVNIFEYGIVNLSFYNTGTYWTAKKLVKLLL